MAESWWKAGEEHNYDVRQKLEKEGCRSVRRLLIECQNLDRAPKTCEKQKE